MRVAEEEKTSRNSKKIFFSFIPSGPFIAAGGLIHALHRTNKKKICRTASEMSLAVSCFLSRIYLLVLEGESPDDTEDEEVRKKSKESFSLP